jgi:hypothetical protein
MNGRMDERTIANRSDREIIVTSDAVARDVAVVRSFRRIPAACQSKAAGVTCLPVTFMSR